MGHQLAIRFCHHETFLINERYLRPGFAAGPLAVPGPVPIVSPVVPLFIAPLLIPVPGLRRLAPFAELLLWLGVAGEIAESPVVVVEPVLAFCARTNEPEKIGVVAAITINFICFSHLDGMDQLTRRDTKARA
jgi:hypothetical protein